MNIKGINDNPNIVKLWIDNAKSAEIQYYKDNLDSLISLKQDIRSK